jgi:hypothetical protein
VLIHDRVREAVEQLVQEELAVALAHSSTSAVTRGAAIETARGLGL